MHRLLRRVVERTTYSLPLPSLWIFALKLFISNVADGITVRLSRDLDTPRVFVRMQPTLLYASWRIRHSSVAKSGPAGAV